MAIPWSVADRAQVEEGLSRHPVNSGRCAALARLIFRVAQPQDSTTHGLQIVPRGAARFVVPRHDPKPRWMSHTLVETMKHRVDALTGANGTAAANYLSEHWEYFEQLHVKQVDVFSIDPGIEDL